MMQPQVQQVKALLKRRDEQIARDAKIARIHAEEEMQMMIDGLDRNNETVAKYLQEYEQFAEDLSIGEKIELINDLVKYQDNYAKVLKYQSQQRKPLSKKQQREFYMSVLKSHSGWKTKHFKGMSLEEIREKFIPIWKQIEDFVPMGSKEEREIFKIKGLRLEQDSAKKIHTEGQRTYWKIIRLGGNTTVYQFFVDMLKHFDKEDLNQLWTLVKETLSIRQATSDKEKELWVKLKRLYEPDVEDQLDDFPLPEDFPTASEERFPLLRVEKLEVDFARAIKQKQANQTQHDKGKGKVHDLDDVDFDDLDLENRIKKLEVDFGRMLKVKKAKEAKEAKQAYHDQAKKWFKYPVMKMILMMKAMKILAPSTRSRSPTAFTSIRSRAPTASTSTFKASIRSIDPIDSTYNAQSALILASRGYMKIAMTRCVLDLRAPDDPNALPPSAPRKRKSKSS
nr:hypothetical protein [Tanacetum cinerariifolium]